MKLKHAVCLGILLLSGAACGPKSTNHLPKEQMEKVLMDVQLAEVYSTMAGKDSAQTQGLKNMDSLAAFYKEVFAHHHIEPAQFTQSLNWYRAHPEELDTVYKRVLNKLDIIGPKQLR